RSLPDRARPAVDQAPDRLARRDARGRAERRRRPLGDPRPRPVHALGHRAFPAPLLRLDTPLLERARAERRARRDRRPDDDGAADHLFGLPRALPQRPERSQAGRGGSRRDALGDGPRRRHLQRARRCRRRRHPRSRACARRGDRRHAGDRQQPRAVPPLAVQHRQDTRQPERLQLLGRGNEPSGRLARLPGADPARDHVHLQRDRAADRAPLRLPAHRRNSVTEPMSLRARGRARRRLRANRVAEAASVLTALIAVGFLAILVGSVLVRSCHAINWDFFTKGPAVFGQTGGGIAPALVGTFLLVLFATLFALPIGVLVALYVSEFAPPRFAQQIKLWLDVLNGFPSIVIGIFVFALGVKTKMPLLGIGHHQSVLACSFALSISMVPRAS